MERVNEDNSDGRFLSPAICVARGVYKIKITELDSQRETRYPVTLLDAIFSCPQSDRRIVSWNDPDDNLCYDILKYSNTKITLIRPKKSTTLKDPTFTSIDNFLRQK